MRIEIEVPDDKIQEMVKNRIAELFSSDCRYRETGVRDALRRIVDGAAVEAVKVAQAAISFKLPEMAAEAVVNAIEEAMKREARKTVDSLKKQFAGFNPDTLTQEQREWVLKQMQKK